MSDPYPLPEGIDDVENSPTKHECDVPCRHEEYRSAFYGPSVTDIVFNDGVWWATAGNEYATAIGFCPFCGEKLPQ